MNGYFDAYAALEARIRIVDVVANNLANSQTTGFKRDFAQVLENEFGVDVRSHLDLSPGELVNTGNGLDAAIDGPGFFTVQSPQGERYTRAGSFSIDAKGRLVTKDGAPVLSDSGTPITVGSGTIAIEGGGTVTEDGSEVARLKVVDFSDVTRLRKEGMYKLEWTGAPDQARTVSEPRVKGGFLERSNVNPVTEMVNLISAYRDFESAQRTVKTMTTEMDNRLIQELSRLT